MKNTKKTSAEKALLKHIDALEYQLQAYKDQLAAVGKSFAATCKELEGEKQSRLAVAQGLEAERAELQSRADRAAMRIKALGFK